MRSFTSSSWLEFEPIVFLLNSLPEKHAIDHGNLPKPTLFCMNLTNFEISFMNLNVNRLSKILASLTKINELISLKISFFFHSLRSDEISQLFLKFLPKLSSLKEFQVSFSQNESFSLKNFEEIGQSFFSLKNLQNLELFFEGTLLFFDEKAIISVFSNLPPKILSLTVKFLSQCQIKKPGLRTLALILNKYPLKNLTLYIEDDFNGDISYSSDFPVVFQLISLESLSLKVSNIPNNLFITDIQFFEVFFQRLSGLKAFYLKLDFLYMFMQKKEKMKFVGEKLDSLRNLTILHLKSSSRILLLAFMPFLKNFSRLLSLELIEKPQDISTDQIFTKKNLVQLAVLRNQLVHLKIVGFLFAEKDFFQEKFKFLTKINRLVGFSLFLAHTRRRKRKVLIAWFLKEKLRKSKVFKRNEVLDEILGFMAC